MATLAQEHDCLLLDLDGTVFRGHEPTTGAVQSLAALDARALYVTNNASRSAAEVAGHLQELGFAATADDVVTSAQSAARLLAGQLPAGAAVLIVGTESLAAEVAAVGLKPVRTSDNNPAAVVQGHNPETAWPILSEAALAIRSGPFGSRRTWTAPCPRNAGCCPATDRWSPRCAPPPMPNLRWPANRPRP